MPRGACADHHMANNRTASHITGGVCCACLYARACLRDGAPCTAAADAAVNSVAVLTKVRSTARGLAFELVAMAARLVKQSAL